MTATLKAAAWATVLTVIAAAVLVVGWRVGWWFQTDLAKHRTQVIRTGYNYQTTLGQEIDNRHRRRVPGA